MIFVSRPVSLLVIVLVLTACADPHSAQPAQSDPAVAEPEPPAHAFSPLARLSPDVVRPGDSATEITITADDALLESGTYFRIERWDGTRWVLQHYVRHGEVQPADLDGFNDDGYGIEPGQTLVERLPLDDLDEGVHRVGLSMWQGDGPAESLVDVYARLDVRTAEDSEVPTASQLDGAEWRSVVVEGLDLPMDQQIQLTFDAGQVSAVCRATAPATAIRSMCTSHQTAPLATPTAPAHGTTQATGPTCSKRR